MRPFPDLALIINTYNQPEYLSRVLKAVSGQRLLPREVLLADDGSTGKTGAVFQEWASRQPFRCEHVWQEQGGFRRSRILNRTIAKAESRRLVFLDGDTVPHPQFLSDHWALTREGFFVQGHRALVEEKAARYFALGDFSADRRRALWTGQLRGLKHVFRWPVSLKRSRNDLRGIRGCNLAIWRSDLVRVNGYNEEFVGWGREDSELALRLMNAGVTRLDVRGWALCYHLWHPPASRERLAANDDILRAAQETRATRCAIGLEQHLPVGKKEASSGGSAHS
jgi:glycosyltransferase involved in cell wall biosynthesis